MNVSERMTINPVICSPDINIYKAVEIMEKEGVHRLPVLDSDGRLLGIISEKDIMKATPRNSAPVSIHEMAHLLSILTVADVMTTEIVTILPSATVEEATRIMVDNEVSCLPIVMDGKLLGIITKSDMYRLLLELFGARHYGVKAYFIVNDKPGIIAEITSELAKKNVDIVSLGSLKHGNGEGALTMKVQGITKEELLTILSPMAIKIIDIREA